MNVGERASAQEVPSDVLNRWRKFLSEEERPTPNAEPDRFLATVSALGSRPVILEIEDGDGRSGMIIARREPMRVSARIGYFRIPTPKLYSLVVVYGGILGRISSESVTDFLTKRLSGTERYDHIMINSLATDSPVMQPLRQVKNVVVHPPILHRRLRLDDTFESIMSRHSGKHRRRLSWERRNLESAFDGKLEWVTLTCEEEVDRVLGDAARIGRRTYHAKVGWLVEENDLWRAQITLAAKRCGWYCGVELSEQAANVAQEQLSEVIVGDIETIDLPWPEQHFDALIMSEVLEHLVDPWRVLRKVRPLMRDGAIVLASSPNVSHHRVIRMLLNGRWDLVEAGTMDRTHLRWFTPNSYAAMFEECGYKVEEMTPLRAFGWRAKLVNVLTLGKLRHLFVVQINVRCRCC